MKTTIEAKSAIGESSSRPMLLRTSGRAPKPLSELLVDDGVLTITPELALRIIQTGKFDRQRPVRGKHVDALAMQMRRKEWTAGTQIHFGRTPDGELHLVNGQHRMHAVIKADAVIIFQILVTDVKGDDDLIKLYRRHDRLIATRTVTDALTADGIPERHGLRHQIATSCFRAIPVIESQFRGVRWAYYLTRSDEARLRMAEVRKGTWVEQTAMFRFGEHLGEVSSYGDYSAAGAVDANFNWPQFQAYLFQTFVECGDLEIDRMGAARINLVTEKNRAAATIINRALNTIYHYGIGGLQNYGMTNYPGLSAALTPSTKAAGGVTWFTSGGAPNAQANEVYNDCIALFQELVNQTNGLIKADDAMTLVVATALQGAFQFTNTFNVNVLDLLKKNFPKLRIVPDALFNAQSSVNPTGSTAGNLLQLYVDEIEGQRTAFCAFNEKMRSHRVVMHESSFRQKKTSGAWGAIILMQMGVAQMVGA